MQNRFILSGRYRLLFICLLMNLLAALLCATAGAQPQANSGWYWIWAPMPAATTPDTVYIRETFRLPAAPTSATLLITADDTFAAFFNGAKKPAAQGSDWTSIHEFNVTRQLVKGANLLAIRATNSAGAAGVLFKLQIVSGGKTFTLQSNSRCKVNRRPPPGWNDVAFQDSSWAQAREVAAVNAGPWGQLHGALVSDPSRLIRMWDIRASLPANMSQYAARRRTGDRMILASSVTSQSDMKLLSYAGFTLFQSDSNHISTEEDARGHWNWTPATLAGRMVNSLGLDWCYSPHCAFPPAFYRLDPGFTRLQCLEHHQPVQAFSPWDPAWPYFIDANYAALARQFPADVDDQARERAMKANSAAISALYVGIHGDYGEAGFLTGGRVSVPSQKAVWLQTFGDDHDHLGWWCDDPIARRDFQSSMMQKYGSIARLNEAWKRTYASPEAIGYPVATGVRGEAKQEWLDFVDWYQGGIAHALDANLSAARKHFPKSMLMVPAGFTDENPRGGNDNSLIPKVAAKYSADIRSTHGGFRPFAENQATMFGRLASACRFYGVPLWTEPPGALSADQEVSRLFEDISQGVKGHFEWAENAVANVDTFYKYARLMKIEKPVVDVAMFYPAEAMKLKPDQGYNGLFAQACTYIRDFANYDIVDDRMVLDDCLSHYRVLALWEGTMASQATLDRIRDWVNAGGTLVAYDFGKVTTFDGDSSWWNDMFGYSRALQPAALKETYVGIIPQQYKMPVGEASANAYLSDDGWEKPDPAVGIATHSSRWTNKPNASIKLPVKPDMQYSLIIRAFAPEEADGLTRTVLVNGKSIGQLRQTGEVTYRFVLPASLLEEHSLATVTFKCDMFKPTSKIPGHLDMQSLGVQIQSVQMVEQGVTSAPEAPVLPGQIRHELDPTKLRNEWAKLHGKGMTIYFPAQKKLLKGYMEVVRQAIYHLSEIDPTSARRDAIPVDNASDGIYATLFTNRILYYNPRDVRVTRKISIPEKVFEAWKDEIEVPSEHQWTITLEPHSIGAINFAPEPQEMLFECEKFTDLDGNKPLANPLCSPGIGLSAVTIPKGGQIGTRFLLDATNGGKYSIFVRCLNGKRVSSVEVLVDGMPISVLDAHAGCVMLAGTAMLTSGSHSITIKNRSGGPLDADFVLLTNDRTIAGYDFASHFTSVE
jgi:Glycosyl hydrolase family 14